MAFSFADWITGYDRANAEAASAADRRRAELDAEKLKQGKIDAVEYERRQATYDMDAEDLMQNQRAEITDTFTVAVAENAQTGLKAAQTAVEATTGAVRETIGFTFKTVFSLLPWWLWLAAAGALFLYLGGDKIIRRRLAG